MVSIGPNTQSHNFTHMFNMCDYRGPTPHHPFPKDTLMSVVATHADFTKFHYIVKLSKMENVLGDGQSEFTLFIPSDEFLSKIPIDPSFFIDMDISTARDIVKNSVMKRKIPSELLGHSPASYFPSLNPKKQTFCHQYFRENLYQ